jgi:hypothetical protein
MVQGVWVGCSWATSLSARGNQRPSAAPSSSDVTGVKKEEEDECTSLATHQVVLVTL